MAKIIFFSNACGHSWEEDVRRPFAARAVYKSQQEAQPCPECLDQADEAPHAVQVWDPENDGIEPFIINAELAACGVDVEHAWLSLG